MSVDESRSTVRHLSSIRGSRATLFCDEQDEHEKRDAKKKVENILDGIHYRPFQKELSGRLVVLSFSTASSTESFRSRFLSSGVFVMFFKKRTTA